MKKTVCVIFGGASSEYEVSLMSSASIIRNLDTEKFDILTLGAPSIEVTLEQARLEGNTGEYLKMWD